LAAPLESDAATRADELAKVAQHADSFLQDLPSLPVYTPSGDRSRAFEAMKLAPTPAPLDQALEILSEQVERAGQHIGSSRFFAYIPSGGLYEAALADYLAAVSNRFSGVGFASPGATRMEEILLRWLAGVVGYPETSEGDLTSGGSMAALSALMAAREAFDIKSSTVAERVVYLTSQTHHTFRKALHIIGMGDCVVRDIETDAGYRMQPIVLRDTIAADRAEGLSPWLVAASAGTTNIGAVDPLDEIAAVTRQENLWLHVDAAYGGAFALCDEGKRRLKGLEQSDSLILDPHKGFFLPGGIGVVLVRDGSKLFDAYHARGTYMQDMFHDTERSPCDFSAELTRPFRALRFWLPLKMFGTAPFTAALEEKLLLAQYFYQQVASIDGIHTGPPPDLSIVTFRYVPASGNADNFNKRLVEAIRDDGRLFLTSTTMDDQYVIRLAVLGYNTHLDDVDTALTVIREMIAQVSAQE
jgi:aromatic-L-amino-acid/L-tryptophan decarboxylase